MDRIYLDYNATSPLAPSVKRWLAKGELLWANPAAQHSSGKYSRARLDEVISFLFQTFHLPDSQFNTVFHSGATEGINSWIQGHCLKFKTLFVYSPLDHACVVSQIKRLENGGHKTLALPLDSNGELKLDEAIAQIKAAQVGVDKTILNWTWVHNETGVVWPLKNAITIKEQTAALIHVDAVQSPGKLSDWAELADQLDAYTYSAHKFGGLKGIGFSFLKKSTLPEPFILGGGQQSGARSGTENAMGAWAMMLALKELQEVFDPKASQKNISDLRIFIDELLKGKGHRIAAKANELNLNTIFFVLNKLPSDMSMPLFDLAGLEVSAGSACGSGTAKPSPVLLSLGEKLLARNGLRLSLSWDLSTISMAEVKSKLTQVFEKIPTL